VISQDKEITSTRGVSHGVLGWAWFDGSGVFGMVSSTSTPLAKQHVTEQADPTHQAPEGVVVDVPA
jgi:hypothetical protein